ncbi:MULTISPECIES: isocitrate lyase/PEP mutase family protein [Marivita]|jgi:2-methylisocitrate lyase-like PEP mutase family enzyme|uniref:Oxaloacetate decarboxylase n=1 Tax=Marivita cryptomonadis TaxID=505252 RepID=A0A9Q2S1R4_9RHOB|nr:MULTISPECIES: oxaloacetate decarboxylase [Marivita]MCR9168348.1 oxaloacetate decarboxylase [Paracoccaceae bacterium]MBM2323683.1 oxaloacetate decarboxylase [Marivita cryptomonadis]MBM2333271.1 oxaloacetate decarboxylase [Marivita cryptomonadis]MBM2342849.1 oxaloacetate decarboxylase [Marivita cryptomonadis]MBM2347519.1 oxaloacetate decarboxylase [Marivita cryptomonadis]
MSISADTYPTGLGRVLGRSSRLRALVEAPGLLMAPGCYDCITARLIARAGFSAVYVTGSGVSMSAIGAPDMGVLSSAELIERAHRIADSVDIPVICDIDTGFGGPINVIRTIREMERAGVSAVQIEDQDFPKKCGHEPGRKLVSVQEMTGRIKAAVDARHDGDFLIIARTDARTDMGLEAALDRAAAYGEAGADILFVESPESRDEMQAINAQLSGPTMANMVEGGRTPLLPSTDLAALGYRLAIYPNSLTRLVGHMGAELLDTLRETGTTDGMRNRMLDHRALWDLFDYPQWTALEDRFTETD